MYKLDFHYLKICCVQTLIVYIIDIAIEVMIAIVRE